MPPVEERKGLLITFRGTPQKQVVSIGCCDPRLPCYGAFASSRCVFRFLPYFPAWAQKVPMVAEHRVQLFVKFRFHNGLDVRGARPVSAKRNSEQALASIAKGWVAPEGVDRNFRNRPETHEN
jgi:hypothetical protein